MHHPSVSTELIHQIRCGGVIGQDEFGKLVLHWFPAAWSLLWTMQRQAAQKTREEDDTVPLRVFKTLRPHVTHGHPCMLQSSVSDFVGNKGVAEVYEVMASDAMHRCAEKKFLMRLYLENEDKLVAIPEGVRLPTVELPAISFIEERYALACRQFRSVLADMSSRPDQQGWLDTSVDPKSCEEILNVMAVYPYRLRLEREYGVHFAYQWPGVIAAVPSGFEKNLTRFRSSAEQVLAIYQHR